MLDKVDRRRRRWLADRKGNDSPASAFGHSSTWSGLGFRTHPILSQDARISLWGYVELRGIGGAANLAFVSFSKGLLSLHWTDILSHCSGLEMGFRNTGSVSGCYWPSLGGRGLQTHRNKSKRAAKKDWKLLCRFRSVSGSNFMLPKTWVWSTGEKKTGECCNSWVGGGGIVREATEGHVARP